MHHKLGTLKAVGGTIQRFSGIDVDSERVSELIHHGMEALTGTASDSEASYLVLLEAMENTKQHSMPDLPIAIRLPEHWWALSFADKARNCVCFAILDGGVGIFRSAKLKLLRRIDVKIRRTANEDLLRDMLSGTIGSRTQQSHRGKGLPAIKRLSDDGTIKRLTVITNAVRADVERNEYVTLQSAFRGTLSLLGDLN